MLRLFDIGLSLSQGDTIGRGNLTLADLATVAPAETAAVASGAERAGVILAIRSFNRFSIVLTVLKYHEFIIDIVAIF